MTLNWLELFPETVKRMLHNLSKELLDHVEEVRIREGRPLEINSAGRHHFLDRQGGLTLRPEEAYIPTREDTHRLLDLISNHSLYTMEEELRKGFITIPGGHRVGLTGRTVLSGGKVEHIRDISGFNVRIAKEIQGAADEMLPHLLDRKQKRVMHTLILSPPQHGKTTLLRDLARQISYGKWGNSAVHWPGMKVGIVDERSEIAGCLRGVPGFDVGPRTDVLDGCPKAEGMMMMIRSMSPDVLIVDEIGRPEDAEAVIEALHAGISVIATAHGSSLQDMRVRPALLGLLENRLFQMYAVLNRNGEHRSYKLYDGGERALQTTMSPSRSPGGDAYA